MADYIRKIVSGNKARFKDPNLNIELDLVYVTDHVIIMGYPASGVEGLYRNRREDARRFLEHRHGKNYWIFNFCPIKENSYDRQYFDGRVSRYPFPDHHAPPLAIMPLVAREMRAWHKGSPDRVSVLHCKAGKGRSGTMACSYLLSLDEIPSPPKLASQHLTAKEWAQKRASELAEIVPDDDESELKNEDSTDNPSLESSPNQAIGTPETPESTSATDTTQPTKSFHDVLHTVLDLHSKQRMKQSTGPNKQRKGVSIPSQRRFLSYWAMILGNQQPPNFWQLSSSSCPPKVKINQINVRIKEAESIKFGLANVASTVIDQMAKRRKSSGGSIDVDELAAPVWVSLARYDDDLVELLETWERRTRAGGGSKMGDRKEDSSYHGDEELSEVFDHPSGTKRDNVKMVRKFARMGIEKGNIPHVEKDSSGKSIWTYPLRPLSTERWTTVKDQINQGQISGGPNGSFEETLSQDLADDLLSTPAGVILNAHREVRLKLYYGHVWMGWCWFIPAFHLDSAEMEDGHLFKIVLTRKDLDFAIGFAKEIVDVEIEMTWLQEQRLPA